MKKVSIIVPIYNSEDHIMRCVGSLINQTYTHLEIILVNDGSTDNSLEQCKRIAMSDTRVKVFSKKNNGVSSARNLGISNVSGEYLTFVDSDDWLEVDAIENMVSLIEEQNADCVRTMHYINTEIAERKVDLQQDEKLYDKHNIQDLLTLFASGGLPCYVPLLIVKSELVAHKLRFNERIHMLEDSVFYLDLLSSISTIYLSNIKTYHYNMTEEGASRSAVYYIRNAQNILLANAEIKRLLGTKGKSVEELVTTMDAEHLRIISIYLFLIYRDSKNARIDTMKLFNLLRDNVAYYSLIQNSDISRYPFFVRYTINCIIDNKLKNLIRYFALRQGMRFLLRWAK